MLLFIIQMMPEQIFQHDINDLVIFASVLLTLITLYCFVPMIFNTSYIHLSRTWNVLFF